MVCDKKNVERNPILNNAIVNYTLRLSLTIVLISFGIAFFFIPVFKPIHHIIFELIYLIVTLCNFSVVWVALDFNALHPMIRTIGFGFLNVSIVSLFHIATFITAYDHSQSLLMNISDPYWIGARIIEALILLYALSIPSSICKTKKNTYIILLRHLVIIALTILSIHILSNGLSHLTQSSYRSMTKVILAMTILLYSIALKLLLFKNTKTKEKDWLNTLDNIAVATLFLIGAAICTLLINPQNHLIMLLGHVFKLSAYCFLLKGVYMETIITPYRKIGITERQLSNILDNLPLGIVCYKKDTGLYYANESALDLFECRFENLSHLTENEFNLTFELKPDLQENGQLRLKTLKGNPIVVQEIRTQVKHYCLIAFKDMRKDQELDHLHIQKNTIYDSIGDQILLLDKNKRILYANETHKDCTGFDTSSIVGLSIAEYSDLIKFRCNEQAYVKNSDEIVKSIQYTLTTCHGETRTLCGSYKKIVDAYGEIIGYVFISNDITEDLKDQKKLQNQEKLALVGQMGNGIVHDTKNYLASIKGYCDLLNLSIEDDTLKTYVSKIRHVADDMNELISHYLNLSTPSDSIPDILSINELIESITYIVKSPSFLKNVKLTLDLCEEDRDVLADDALIKHVIINLAKNAVEAMDGTDNPHLIIGTRINGHFMTIIVKDNGCGMTTESIQKLGTPFFTTKEHGTGLGLNNCYKIIQDSHGQIDVKSTLGKGTTFYVILPIYEDEYDFKCTSEEAITTESYSTTIA